MPRCNTGIAMFWVITPLGSVDAIRLLCELSSASRSDAGSAGATIRRVTDCSRFCVHDKRQRSGLCSLKRVVHGTEWTDCSLLSADKRFYVVYFKPNRLHTADATQLSSWVASSSSAMCISSDDQTSQLSTVSVLWFVIFGPCFCSFCCYHIFNSLKLC